MKNRFRLFRHKAKRGFIYYLQDNETGKQESLKTTDREKAEQVLNARNIADANPLLSRELGKTYLRASDPSLITRRWEDVMEELCSRGGETTQKRYERAMAEKNFDAIRKKHLVDTTSQDFLSVLKAGTSTTNHYLRRLHNLASGLGWLLAPVVPPDAWPKPQWRKKRAVTSEEHEKIIDAEKNHERKLYYALLWETGSAQSDAASLTGDNIDWKEKVLSYRRQKTGVWCWLRIGARLRRILERLPSTGPLFPKLSTLPDRDRSAEFYRRCKLVQIKGISLHSYRYAWAERAYTGGVPERFAQAALGHSSKAVHRAYAKGAKVICPALDSADQLFLAEPETSNDGGVKSD
jgi:integrase